MLENIRWDLKRTSNAKGALATEGKSLSDKRLRYPIPKTEIDKNPEISQSDQNSRTKDIGYKKHNLAFLL